MPRFGSHGVLEHGACVRVGCLEILRGSAANCAGKRDHRVDVLHRRPHRVGIEQAHAQWFNTRVEGYVLRFRADQRNDLMARIEESTVNVLADKAGGSSEKDAPRCVQQIGRSAMKAAQP